MRVMGLCGGSGGSVGCRRPLWISAERTAVEPAASTEPRCPACWAVGLPWGEQQGAGKGGWPWNEKTGVSLSSDTRRFNSLTEKQ